MQRSMFPVPLGNGQSFWGAVVDRDAVVTNPWVKLFEPVTTAWLDAIALLLGGPIKLVGATQNGGNTTTVTLTGISPEELRAIADRLELLQANAPSPQTRQGNASQKEQGSDTEPGRAATAASGPARQQRGKRGPRARAAA